MLHASDAVQYQFSEEPVKAVLSFPIICLYTFFLTAANPPVGTYAHGLGTHALHEDAKIKADYRC